MSENPPIHENSLDDFRALHQEVLLFWDLGLPLVTTLEFNRRAEVFA
jgi:hypothetical protein